MDYLIIIIVALFASALTFFSGFGLGTILLPAFALFFPVDQAVAMTAIVHLLNNLFKMTLLGKNTNFKVFLLFGLPAMLAAYFGAYLLKSFHNSQSLFHYEFFGTINEVNLDKLVIALLIIFFALYDLIPSWSKSISVSKKFLALGGFISGFFGGLSGHQGALRSAFLIKLNMAKESFVATGVLIAVVIDLTRLTVYRYNMDSILKEDKAYLLFVAIVAAFLGAIIGKRLLKKITIAGIQKMVGALMIVIALLMGSGII